MMDRDKLLDKENLLALMREEDDLLKRAEDRHKANTGVIKIALSVLDDNEKAEAINTVLSMLSDSEKRLSSSSPPNAEQLFTETRQETEAASKNGKSKPSKGGGVHYRRILHVLPSIEGDVITQPIVRAKLLEVDPEYGASVQVPTISSTLRQLVEAGELELVKKGFGGHPHEYRRIE